MVPSTNRSLGSGTQKLVKFGLFGWVLLKLQGISLGLEVNVIGGKWGWRAGRWQLPRSGLPAVLRPGQLGEEQFGKEKREKILFYCLSQQRTIVTKLFVHCFNSSPENQICTLQQT